MRILILNWKDIAHPAAGGAEVFTYELARRWVEWGHEVTWFASEAHERPAEEILEGVRIVRRGNRLTVYREARRYYQRQGVGRFDVVIDEVNTRPFLTPSYVRDAPVVGLIYQVARDVWSLEAPFPVSVVGRYWLEPRWLRLYRDIPMVTISESSRESFVPYGLGNVDVIPVGMHVPPAVMADKEPTPTVVFAGRLTASKRPFAALDAFEIARRHIPDAQMWVLGTGPLEKSLRRRASSAVRFFGRVSDADMLELLSRAHALIMTSLREGWGLVVTEAALMGTRTISYDVPGLRDSVPASDGVLVPPDPESLGTRLAQLLPVWFASPRPNLPFAGVAPWAEVAEAMLGHLAVACEAH